MIHRFGLYIIAAFISFALSSIGTTIDEATSLAVSNLVCENLLSQNSETFSLDDTDAGCTSLMGNNTKNRIDTPTIRHFSSSGRFRLSVRRTSNVYHVAIDNGDNTIHNTPHSLICFMRSNHSSDFNEPARYLIRLRKFII